MNYPNEISEALVALCRPDHSSSHVLYIQL